VIKADLGAGGISGWNHYGYPVFLKENIKVIKDSISKYLTDKDKAAIK